MQRITDREVELTGEEQLVQMLFHQLLSEGYGITVAVEELREDVQASCPGVQLTEEFWSWLAN